ncbi:MAG: bifunctional heptose 7-phosphate kinase/heptose 1-phosphate adenyltransferase [Bacteroidia bacterium]
MEVTALAQKIRQTRFLVLGDGILDRYIYGHAERISPEAPVPVIEVQREENRLGGAANVLLNLLSLGCDAYLCCSLGEDYEGQLFESLLRETGVSLFGVMHDPMRPTTTKIRVIAQGQHVLRIDKENRAPLSHQQQEKLLQKALQLLPSVGGVIFEDYDKGVLSPYIIREIIGHAQQNHIPVFVDPKFQNFWSYEGATLFKPNLKELGDALRTSFHHAPLRAVEEGILELRQRMPHTYTVVTLGENGILAYSEEEGFFHDPAHKREIVDVSGAGDTVISVLATCVTTGLPLHTAVKLANLAGGIVCEHVGVVPLPRERWLREAAIHVVDNAPPPQEKAE